MSKIQAQFRKDEREERESDWVLKCKSHVEDLEAAERQKFSVLEPIDTSKDLGYETIAADKKRHFLCC